MNGPTPIMFDMFRAVACTSPKRLSRGAASFSDLGDSDGMEIIETCLKLTSYPNMRFFREFYLRIGSPCESGTGVPPVNHAQDARAAFLERFVRRFIRRKVPFAVKLRGVQKFTN